MTYLPLPLELAVFAVAVTGSIGGTGLIVLFFHEARERRRGPYVGRILGNVRTPTRPPVVEHPVEHDRRVFRYLRDGLELIAIALIAVAVLVGSS